MPCRKQRKPTIRGRNSEFITIIIIIIIRFGSIGSLLPVTLISVLPRSPRALIFISDNKFIPTYTAGKIAHRMLQVFVHYI